MRIFFSLITLLLLIGNTAVATERDSTITKQVATANDTIISQADSLLFAESPETKRLFDNLDSMVHLWYVDRAIKADSIEYAASLADTTKYYPLPDSVYIQRINNLESVIQLSFNPTVKRRIEVYTIRARKRVQTLLGLSHYYFPMFEEVLDSYGLPLELKYLPIVESALNPRAVSWAGATGIWQFMYATGKIYDLNINSFVDERRDPLMATHAAARFFKKLYSVYGDWNLALAAYNCGPGNVNKAIRRSGGKTNYWEIYPYLPRETRGYVPAFIAATYLANYYEEHNIVPRPTEFPMVTDTLRIKEKLHLQQVAEVLDIPMKQLQDLNPQYRRNIIPKKNKTPYALRLPLEYSTKFIELEDSIYNYKDSIFFAPKSHYTIPKRYEAHYDAPNIKNKTKLSYTIKSGDNLGSIAKWYNVKVRDIRHWNGLYGNRIRAGKKLAIYVSKNKVAQYRKVNSMSFDAKQKMIGENTDKSYTVSNPQKLDEKYVYYKVRRGDNLWTIAKKYPGISNLDIMRINNFSDNQAKNLKLGQWIKIKKKI